MAAKSLLTREQWDEVHLTAVALQSIRAAAKAHGVSEEAAYKRAQRESWLAGDPATVTANRAERAQAAGVIVQNAMVRHRPTGEVLDNEIQRMGGQTRVLLAQSLVHAAGQARTTKHPLAKARQINDITTAAAKVHGWDKSAGGDVTTAIQINLNVG